MKFKNLKFYLLTILSIFLFSLKTYAVDVNIGGILLPNNVFNANRINNILFVLNQARTFINNDHNDNNNNQRNLESIGRMLERPNDVQIEYRGHPTIITNENNEPTVTQSVIFSLDAIPLTDQGQIRFNGGQLFLFIDFISTNIFNLHRIDITNIIHDQNELNTLFAAVRNNATIARFLRGLNIPLGNHEFELFNNMMGDRHNINHVQRITGDRQDHLYIMISSGNACHLFDFLYNRQ